VSICYNGTARCLNGGGKDLNKYNARKTPYDGYVFDSGKECQRYKDLRLLEKAGEIYGLTVHPKFILQEGFMWHGKKIRPITYTADFMYQEDGNTIVSDVKGGKATQTQLFKVKVKMLKKRFPNLIFRIVV